MSGGLYLNTLEVIKKRVSIRKYKQEQISEDALQTIIKAGCAAPVGSGDYNSLHIAVVQNNSLLSEISLAVNDFVFKMLGKKMDKDFGAPTMIIVSSRPAMMLGIEYANAACVLENMILAATDKNIGNILWAGAAVAIAQNNELREKIGIPEGFTPILCASFGYPEVNEEPKNHTIAVNRIY